MEEKSASIRAQSQDLEDIRSQLQLQRDDNCNQVAHLRQMDQAMQIKEHRSHENKQAFEEAKLNFESALKEYKKYWKIDEEIWNVEKKNLID